MFLGIPDIYSISVCNSFIPLFKLSLYLIVCYILSLLVAFLPVSCRRFFKIIILLFAAIFFVVDIYLILLYNQSFGTISKNAIAALLATNIEESLEYINTYFTIEKLLVLVAFVSVPTVLFHYLRKLCFKWNNIYRGLLLLLLLCSAIITMRNVSSVKDSNFYYLLTKECPDLREYKQNPIVICDSEKVDNIVLVIGESFSKHHSSLYGYGKETNPLLSKLVNDSALFVYENVTSACASTIPALKSIMTSYIDGMNDSIEWYKCLTLIEIMQNAGYKTFWFSNQSKTGVYDNEVGRFADLCNIEFFVGQKHSFMSKMHYDEELLAVVNDCLLDDCKTRFVIVHMAGSHAEYNKRYPSSFSKFKNVDYNISHTHLSSDSKRILSEYDNSVFYNDSVVYELMRDFEQESTIVIYLSDHGEDVFYSSTDFYGHLDNSLTQVELQIPFMVYTSPLFREKHPDLQLRIQNAVNCPYRTDSIMYSIMDIAGVETVNGISYKHKSLFK